MTMLAVTEQWDVLYKISGKHTLFGHTNYKRGKLSYNVDKNSFVLDDQDNVKITEVVVSKANMRQETIEKYKHLGQKIVEEYKFSKKKGKMPKRLVFDVILKNGKKETLKIFDDNDFFGTFSDKNSAHRKSSSSSMSAHFAAEQAAMNARWKTDLINSKNTEVALQAALKVVSKLPGYYINMQCEVSVISNNNNKNNNNNNNNNNNKNNERWYASVLAEDKSTGAKSLILKGATGEKETIVFLLRDYFPELTRESEGILILWDIKTFVAWTLGFRKPVQLKQIYKAFFDEQAIVHKINDIMRKLSIFKKSQATPGKKAEIELFNYNYNEYESYDELVGNINNIGYHVYNGYNDAYNIGYDKDNYNNGNDWTLMGMNGFFVLLMIILLCCILCCVFAIICGVTGYVWRGFVERKNEKIKYIQPCEDDSV